MSVKSSDLSPIWFYFAQVGENGHEKSCPVQHENEEWTPYNGDLHMQGIKVGWLNFISLCDSDIMSCGPQVIVNSPLPKKPKVDAFEDTMLLIDIYRHKMQLDKFEKKVKWWNYKV